MVHYLSNVLEEEEEEKGLMDRFRKMKNEYSN